jgi:two-component system, NarL family, response regulator NreC
VLGTVVDHLGVIRAVHILQPDVLVLESMRLSLSAVEVTQQVTARGVHTHVVIVSMHAEQTSLIRALRSGVAGVVLKRSDPAELIHAVRAVANGQYYLSPRLWHALEGYAERMRNTGTADARLTVVERRILELVATGHRATRISMRLSLTRTAVEAHCRALMRKFGLRTHTDLAVYALRRRVAVAQLHTPATPRDLH